MSEEKVRNRTKKALGKGSVILIIVAFVVIVGLSFWFMTRSVNNNIINTNIATMEELARHDESSIAEAIELRFDCMESLAGKLAVRDFRDFDDMFGEMSRIARSVPSADTVSFLDSEGTEFVSNGIVTKNSYLTDVCKGKTDRFIVRLNTSAYQSEQEREVLFEAVPVSFTVEGHKMEWMLCRFPIDTLENELKISSYNGEGCSFVIDGDGYYTINMSKTHSFLNRENFFEDLKDAKFDGYSSIDEVRTTTTTGATSVIYTKDGQTNIMVILTLDIADWYFVTTVPMSVFSAQTRAIISRFIILLVIMAVILAVILYLVFRQRKERELAEQEKYLKEAEERRKLIEGITASYNVAYVVNMAEDTFEQLRMDETIIGYEQAFTTFTQAKEFFLDLLYPLDRERMRNKLDYDRIRKKLSESKSFDAEYRVPINGAMIWHKMNVTSIDADTVTIGFAVEDLGITKKHLEDKRFSEYFALYEVDLDTESAKIVIDSPYYPVDRSGTAVPYKTAMLAFADSLEGDAREFFIKMTDIDYVRKVFEREDKFTYSYRSENIDKKWVDLTSFVTLRHPDGTLAMFTLGFNYIDSFGAAKQELQQEVAEKNTQLEESLTFTNYFLDTYISAYYVGFEDRSCQVYKRTEELEKGYPILSDYMESLTAYINRDVHPEDREELFEFVKPERMKTLLAERTEYTHAFRDISSGTEKIYLLHVIRGADMDHAAFGFRDITEETRRQREQQETLEQALEKAESSNRAKTEFLFNMSHDIRTPMNAITGFTAMARKYIDDITAVKDYLEKIDSSGKQLLSLVNNVLEMSRIESGNAELEEKPVNIRQAFNATTTILSEQAQINGQEFHYTFENMEHFDVFADETKVSSITLNILGNALKYTPEGGRIDFDFKEIPGRKPGYASYTLTVKDTGIGMSQEFLDTLFDPFAREKTSTVSGIQGTGLGMAIVKRFVDLMGGEIIVQSEAGKGTRFDVTLDFRINENAGTEAVKPENIAVVSFKGRKALLVEDNELNREIALDILEEEGLEVENAEDGSVAVELMREKGPDYYDFILMDIQMPVMDGYEATRAIRTMYPDADIPIIAISANAFEEDKRASKEAGMDGHIAKPIDVRELFSTLARFL